MWFWQLKELKKLSANQTLWGRLFIVSTTFHCLLLFGLFFVYQGYTQLSIDIMNTPCIPADVVLMPLHKVVAKDKVLRQNSKKTAEKKASEQPEKQQERTVQAKPEVPSKPTTGVSSAPRKAKKPVTKKKEAKKLEQKKQKKDDTANKKESEKKAEPLVESKKEEVVPPTVEKPLPVESASAPENSTVYVGREELIALQLQQEIQKEIEQHWHPPAGLAPTIACQIKALINWDGTVQEVKVEQPSGVLVFDVHARSVAQSITFPKAVWGKELLLNFNNQA